MKNINLIFAMLVASGIMFSFVQCSSGDDGEAGPMADPILSSIIITSSSGNMLDLNGTTTTKLSAAGRDQYNNAIAVPGGVTWAANNTNVNVDAYGNVSAQKEGPSVVTASSGSISANFTITVVDSTPESGTFIYVSDAGNFSNPPWQILRYNINGGDPQVFIDQQLGWPQDIVFLEENNVVLISNLNSGQINRHNASTGAFINSFATGISGPTRIKIGPDNLLYVLQWNDEQPVLRYELDGTFVDQFTSLGVNRAIGLDWDAEGSLYVSSYLGFIRKFDSTGSDLGNFAVLSPQGPTNIWIDEEGFVYANNYGTGNVSRFDSEGTLVGNFITGLSQPEGVAMMANGNLLIGNSSAGSGSVKLFSGSGTFISDLVAPGTGNLMTPNAITVRVIP